MPTRSSSRRSIAEFMRAERTRFGALVLFLVLVFLMGGGSRPDIQSLVLLRPLAILAAAYALTVAKPDQLRSVRAPLALLLALLGIMIAQMVPLPPGLWAALPGRDIYSETVAAAEVADRWRPISLSPSRTMNSIFSLSVPIAAVLLFAIQEQRYWRPMIVALLSLAVLSSLWGLLQLVGSSTGPLYLYRVTNAGLPVGLFANRNHQAVVLAAFIPIIAYLALSARSAPGERRLGSAAWFAVLLLVPTVLMTGSRAGLMALALALAALAPVFYFSRRERGSGRGLDASRARVGWIIAGALAFIGVTATAAMWLGRTLAVERMMGEDALEDLRAKLVSTLTEMIATYFPVGSGFGSFDPVYDRFEPTSTLSDQYLNNAHSDWPQLLIEGGLPAGLLLLLFLVWLGRHAVRTITQSARDASSSVTLRLAAISFIVVQGAGSIVDYPLRVPSVMAVFAILCALLSASANAPVARRVRGAGEERG